MPDTLDRALRDVIDASADPVTVDEVLGLPAVPLHRKRRAPLLLAAAAVVVLAVVVGLVLSTRETHDEDSVDRQVSASTPAPTTPVDAPPVESCLVRPLVGQRRTPCPVTDTQAEVMLGIDINEPEGIPDGWTLVNHEVRWSHAADYGLPHDLGDYNRSWWEDPDQVDSSVPCDQEWDGECWPPYLQVNVRAALPGDDPADAPADERDTLAGHLEDGTAIWGTLPDPDGRLGPHAWATWVRGGQYYRLRAAWVEPEVLLHIAESLA
jgi:hypothetical protein